MATANQIEWTCDACGAKVVDPQLPAGWTNVGDKIVCNIAEHGSATFAALKLLLGLT
jgi:hypothetical protein